MALSRIGRYSGRARRRLGASGRAHLRSPAPSIPLPTTFEWIVASLATAVLVGLMLMMARHAGGLWRDEAQTAYVASRPSLVNVWRLTEFESQPPPWSLVLRGWMAVAGSSDASLRTFAVLCGLSLAVAVWFAVRRMGRTVPLLSVAWLAVNSDLAAGHAHHLAPTAAAAARNGLEFRSLSGRVGVDCRRVPA